MRISPWILFLAVVATGSFAITLCDLQIHPSATGVKRVDPVKLSLSACDAFGNASASAFAVAFGSLKVPVSRYLQTDEGTLELEAIPPLLPFPGIVDIRVLKDDVSILYFPRAFTYYGLFAVDNATLLPNNEVHIVGRNLPTAMKPSISLRLTLKNSVSPLLYPLVVQTFTETEVSAVAACAQLAIICTSDAS